MQNPVYWSHHQEIDAAIKTINDCIRRSRFLLPHSSVLKENNKKFNDAYAVIERHQVVLKETDMGFYMRDCQAFQNDGDWLCYLAEEAFSGLVALPNQIFEWDQVIQETALFIEICFNSSCVSSEMIE